MKNEEDQEALPLSTFYYGVPLVVDMECYIYREEEIQDQEVVYLFPCLYCAYSVWAFNSHENKTFKLHVYLISVHSDMMAIKYVMNFKGPNGKPLCCACHITRV